MGKGKGGKGGKPGESNEDAMFRMMGGKDSGTHRGKGMEKGGGGKGGKGKGWSGDGPPSLEEIPEGRRKVLSDQLEAFVGGSDAQFELPPTLTGLERKFVHSRAEGLGLTSQSFGQGRDRYICVFRPEGGPAAPAEAAEASGGSGELGHGSPAAEREGNGDVGQQGEEHESETDLGPVLYSAVVLDEASSTRLQEFCGRAFSDGIPGDWTVHADHMTICVGSLTEPLTEDSRSVADAIRKQTALLKVRQELDLKVVSTGWSGKVMAVGVVGCTSCNKNPHITVATAPQVQPRQSNDIRRWDMLPPEKQIALHGMVWQRGGQRPHAPPAWIWQRAEAASGTEGAQQLAEVVLAGTVQFARAVLRGEKGGRPKNESGLRTVLQLRAIPKRLYAVHPVKLAQALGDELPNGREVVCRLEADLRSPAGDPLKLFKLPCDVPAEVLQRTRQALRLLVAKTPLPVSELTLWLISQAYCSSGVDVAGVVRGLTEAGAVRVGEDGCVEYVALGEEARADALGRLPYSRPWPLEKPKRKEAEAE